MLKRQHGFSLIELSIVLVVSGLLLRSAIQPLPQLRESAQRKQSLAQLQSVKRALLGYVIHTGTLPCPLSTDSLYDTSDQCQVREGYVPAAQLGVLGAIDSTGAVLDVWGRPLRYIVSQADHPELGLQGKADWSTPGEIAAIGLPHLQADLRLCLTTKACSKRNLRADQLVAIVISDGADNSENGAQQENQDGDTDFVLRAYTQTEEDKFDDMLITFSRSDMAYWLLQTDWLQPTNLHP